MEQIIVHKNRTTKVRVRLGTDVSSDTFVSEIRADKNHTSDLLATWSVSFETDGTDGDLILTLDNSVTGAIEKPGGYMDLKRISSGEPLSVFNEPLEVLFQETITA